MFGVGFGDRFWLLNAMLSPEGTLSTGIRLTRDTMYCVDNEAVRYLAALKNGVTFSDKEVAVFSESWSRSVTDMNRLLHYIAGLVPHEVSFTRKLNEARDMVGQLYAFCWSFLRRLTII